MEKTTTIPRQMYNKMGSMSVNKGNQHIKTQEGKEEKALFSWDAIQDCQNLDCPAANLCHFERHGQCKAQMQYMKSLQTIIFRNFSALGEEKMYRVGMHLSPLYSMLSKFKIAELGIMQVLSVNKMDTYSVHPIYKEIRETIKLIENTWKSIGVHPSDTPDLSSGMDMFDDSSIMTVQESTTPNTPNRNKSYSVKGRK